MSASSPHLLFSLLSLFSSAALTVLVLRDYRNRGAFPFAGLNLSLAAWQLGKLAKNLSLSFAFPVSLEFWDTVSFAGASFVPVFFLRLASQMGLRDRTWLAQASWLSYPVFGLFVYLEHAGVLTTGLRATPYGYFHNPGPLYGLYFLAYFLCMVLATWIFYPGHYRKVEFLHRQARAIFLGAILGWALGFLEFMSIYHGPIYPIADLAPLLYGGSLFWAIYRFNMMNAAALMRWIVMASLYLLLIIGAGWAIHESARLLLRTAGMTSFGFLFVFAASLVFFLLTPLFMAVYRLWMRRFAPLRQSAQELFALLGPRLAGMENPDAMFTSVLAEMKRLLGHSRASGVIFSYSQGAFHPARFRTLGDPLPARARPELLARQLPVSVLSRNRILTDLRFGILRGTRKQEALSALRLLRRLESELLVPVMAKEQPVGYFLLPESSFRAEPFEKSAEILVAAADLLAHHIRQVCLLKERSEEAHLVKTGLIAATLAHEIKNPLEAIYGAAQILKDEAKGHPRFVEMILKDAVRLNDTIGQFLLFARPGRLQPGPMDLAAWACDFAGEQSPLDPNRPLSLQLDIDPAPLVCDPGALRQILLNLVQNARRYQPAGQPLELELKAGTSAYRLTIRDRGPGVPAAERERLFEPFYTTSTKGTGLGLATSRKLARELGGELFFSPADPGACFTLVLPKGDHEHS